MKGMKGGNQKIRLSGSGYQDIRKSELGIEWIPAFTGMTILLLREFFHSTSSGQEWFFVVYSLVEKTKPICRRAYRRKFLFERML